MVGFHLATRSARSVSASHGATGVGPRLVDGVITFGLTVACAGGMFALLAHLNHVTAEYPRTRTDGDGRDFVAHQLRTTRDVSPLTPEAHTRTTESDAASPLSDGRSLSAHRRRTHATAARAAYRGAVVADTAAGVAIASRCRHVCSAAMNAPARVVYPALFFVPPRGGGRRRYKSWTTRFGSAGSTSNHKRSSRRHVHRVPRIRQDEPVDGLHEAPRAAP